MGSTRSPPACCSSQAQEQRSAPLRDLSGLKRRPPALTVEPVNAEPFIEVVEKRVGRVRVESTPSGAEAIVDGRSYGKTPDHDSGPRDRRSQRSS